MGPLVAGGGESECWGLLIPGNKSTSSRPSEETFLTLQRSSAPKGRGNQGLELAIGKNPMGTPDTEGPGVGLVDSLSSKSLLFSFDLL